MLAFPSSSSEPRFHAPLWPVPAQAFKIPCSARSTAHANGAEAPWAQRPSERPVRFAVSPVGASRLLMPLAAFEKGVIKYVGMMRSPYEGLFSPTSKFILSRLRKKSVLGSDLS